VSSQYRLFYDRQRDTIEGFLTLQVTNQLTGVTIKTLNRLPARSGQNPLANTSWERGKSPIPFNNQVQGKELWVHLSPIKQEGTILAPPKGIGEAWPVSTSLSEKDTIWHANGKQKRTLIRIHDENNYRGSAGCIVIVNDSDYMALHAAFHELKNEGLRVIPLVVL
jgi:hypothetical protein